MMCTVCLEYIQQHPFLSDVRGMSSYLENYMSWDICYVKFLTFFFFLRRNHIIESFQVNFASLFILEKSHHRFLDVFCIPNFTFNY